jgi:hypothetical protein
MRVLVACEFSGVVREAFRARGHDAWSCDLLPTEKPSPYHIQGDCLSILADRWDLLIAHPPCTYLTLAGVRHLHSIPSQNGVLPKVHGEERWQAMREACAFFTALLNAPIPCRAIENPIPHGYATKIIGPYSQKVQPWMFGHGETKATCFWLRNLPLLERTHRKEDLFALPEPTGRVQRLHKLGPSPDRAKLRSITFQGIANAMAEQWVKGDRSSRRIHSAIDRRASQLG